MAWLPRWVITRGLFAGVTPHGTLNGIPTYLGGNLIVASPYLSGGAGYYEDYFTHELEKSWEGAYGSNAESMIRYAQQHGSTDGILLAEFTVNNPPNAAYYKQTITFYGEVEYTKIQDEHSDIDHVICSVNKMCRLVYTNPSSTPVITHTWLYRPFQGPNAFVYHSGDQSDMRVWFYDSLRCGFGYLKYSNEEYFGAFLYSEVDTFYDDNPLKGNQGCILAVKCSELSTAFGVTFDENDDPVEATDDPNDDPENPGNEEGGGDGDHERPVDPIPVPDLPSLGATDAGFITMYRLTATEMRTFAQRFFATDILGAIKNFFSNPMDIFVGLGIIPFEPDASTTWYPLIGETYLSHQMLSKLDSQFWAIDCGSITIKEYGKNCFDYAPYTKITIFLPYIGYRQLPVDEVMGKTISVKYHCDCLTGDCIAFISTQVMPQGMKPPVGVVIAEYNGNILTHCPVASQSFDSAVSAAISLSCAGVGMIAGDAISGVSPEKVGNQASQLIAASSNVVAGLKPNVKRDGAIAAAAGYMGVQRPYIIREIPNQSLPDNYHSFFGYPSNISGTLNDGFSGFAIVEDIQLNNIPAMEDERKEIMELLREGVII